MKKTLFGLFIALALIIGLLETVNGTSASFSDTEDDTGDNLDGWQATPWIQTDKPDYELGFHDNVDIYSYPGDVIISGNGSGGGGQFFAFRGDGTTAFWSYDVSSNSWTAAIEQAPEGVGPGGALVYDGSDYIYGFKGNDTQAFWRYSISGDSWTAMTDAPGSVRGGGSLVYVAPDYIYAFQGSKKKSESKAFWRYRISRDSWTSMTDAPDTVGDGGSLVYDRSGSIYAFRGNGTKDFWQYTISTGTWTTTLPDTPGNVGLGGSLAFDGSRYIYALRGSNSNHFWRYDTLDSTPAWETLAVPPSNIDEGGSLVYDGGDYLYALRGDGTAFFWRYSISAGDWDAEDTLADAPASIHRGGALCLAGGGTPSINTGILASAVLNAHLTGAKLNALFWEEDLPSGDTDITFEVRASPDSFHPEDETIPWVSADPADKNSPIFSFSSPVSGQYMQWRATLTTNDSSQTPILHEVRLYYY
jgi:hypothetical protein